MCIQVKTFRKVKEKTYLCFDPNDPALTDPPSFGDVSACNKIDEKLFELTTTGTGYNDTRCRWNETQYESTGILYTCDWIGLGKKYSQPRANILGILFFCIFFAVAITRIKNNQVPGGRF